MTITAPGQSQHVQRKFEEHKKIGGTPKWFLETVTILPPAQTLLEQYPGLAPDEVVPHVTDLVSGISSHYSETRPFC